ncbi:MAG: hypothetical protein LC687_04780 [Actinobacteria bacterium]|nr:hypothetical protein [Actinomycetota bacterium]MCA1807149.1 hypothetical protein [Actinomycetota bacterium]
MIGITHEQRIEQALKGMKDYAKIKLEKVTFKAEGVVTTTVKVLDREFETREEATEFLQNKANELVEKMVNNRDNLHFVFEEGVYNSYREGAGPAYPNADGWEVIFEFVKNAYGEENFKIFKEVTVREHNSWGNGNAAVCFSHFFPHIEYKTSKPIRQYI